MTEIDDVRRSRSDKSSRKAVSTPPMMAEMMRSFVVLAQIENLTGAVSELGVTRQTVRRHITQLEELLGCDLLVPGPKGYSLTEDGERHLTNANWTLRQMEDWVTGCVDVVGHLQQVTVQLEDNRYFCGRQHKLSDVWRLGTSSIQQCFRAWIESEGNVQHPLIEEIRPKMVFFRKQKGKWLYIHVGDESSMADWLGLVWARSEVGSFLENDLMSSDADRFVSCAYDETLAQGTVRFDHIATTLARTRGGPPEPVNYQRLLMACRLPNGSPVLGALRISTDKIEVPEPVEFDLLPMADDVIRRDG